MHEMVHAAQYTQGVMSCVGAPHRYDTFTEFCAITVQNMYAAERHRSPIAHHQSWEMRRSDRVIHARATRRMIDEAQMLDRFRRLMPTLTSSLSNLPRNVVPYNPFHQLASWRRLYGPNLTRPLI
ncbi:MAG TPA: hypothetical protein RMH99_01385 [Sandaracinaceae bacterium LLY-WYZ-13_1]|nr:hypothetical protein [Sandaracinaceae bacterium LLY-WYZ-13_1]